MTKDEIIEIVKTAVEMCDDTEVFDECGKCPLKQFCLSKAQQSLGVKI